MIKNLNKHIKSDKAKWAITSIVLVLIIIILVGMCLQMFGQGKIKPSEWFKKNNETSSEAQKEAVEDVLEVEIENSPRVLMAQGDTYAVTASNESYFETTLTATVLPADASNKEVDWSVAWSAQNDLNKDKNVEDYVRAIPQSNGSNVAVVRIINYLSAFKVTATTREGGFTATCSMYASSKPYSIAETTVSCSYNLKNSDGESIDRGNQTIAVNNGFYNLPLLAYSGGSRGMSSILTIVSFQRRFGDTNCYIHDSHFKVNVKSSDGATIDTENFTVSYTSPQTSNSINFTIQYNVTFENQWRSKIATSSNVYVEVEFYSLFYKKAIGSLKLKFYNPTSSVSLSETQIEL